MGWFIHLNGLSCSENFFSVLSKMIHSWIVLFFHLIHLLDFLLISLIHKALHSTAFAGLNSFEVLDFLHHHFLLTFFYLLQIVVDQIKLSVLWALPDQFSRLVTVRCTDCSTRRMPRYESIFVFVWSKFIQSTDSKMFISSDQIIMLEFYLRKCVRDASEFLLMNLLFVIHKVPQLFLSILLLLDIVIVLLSSDRLLLHFEVVHPILKHRLHHLLVY